jgi:hypothetical protein
MTLHTHISPGALVAAVQRRSLSPPPPIDMNNMNYLGYQIWNNTSQDNVVTEVWQQTTVIYFYIRPILDETILLLQDSNWRLASIFRSKIELTLNYWKM